MARFQLLGSDKEVVIAYVFQERGLKDIAGQRGVSDSTVRRRLLDFGVSIRNTHEQRRCDRKRGRYSQAEAVRAAWQRGAYDTEAYRSTRHRWYSYAACHLVYHGRRELKDELAAAREAVLARIRTGSEAQPC